MNTDRRIKLVAIRQLVDAGGKQVCKTDGEACHFYVEPRPNYGASCNHCQRGIPDNRPHRLCPVLEDGTNGEKALGFAIMKHLGPHALTGGAMSPIDAFTLGWDAGRES